MAFRCPRWTVANILPVGFVFWVVGTIWFLYMWLHLSVLLQIGCPPEQLDEAARRRGLAELVISQSLTLVFVICFFRAVCTDPGSVPQTPEWMSDGRDAQLKRSKPPASSGEEHLMGDALCRELKHSGERRFCKWCESYKPDRCHHCRVCKSCILRMDHHCPWIANCVGFGNHKYFFLLVLYALLTLVFIIVTMSETMFKAIHEETPPVVRFLYVFCMTLSCLMGFLLILFFAFHSWLMLCATTTIEFCEKRYKQDGNTDTGRPPSYDLDAYSNICAVLGSVPFFWLLPVMPPAGDGLFYRIKDHTHNDLDTEKHRDPAKKHSVEGPNCNELAPEVVSSRAAAA